MSDIGQLPPAWRIPPSLPGKGAGQRDPAQQRKPDNAQQQQQEQRRKRQQDDDDVPTIDEYA